MNALKEPIPNILYYILLCVSIVVVLSLFYIQLLKQTGEHLEIRSEPYNTVECVTSLENGETFLIYGWNKFNVSLLMKFLCSDSRIAQKYSVIKGQWQHHKAKNLSALSKPYDLVVSKPSFINMEDVKAVANYHPIASYKSYPSYFINNTGEEIKITNRYFYEKKVGLLVHPRSFSGRIEPMNSLRNAGINLNLMEFSYYNSHQELRSALLNNKVDVIGSYWSKEDESILNSKGRLLLNKSVDPSTWYLTSVDEDTECAVVETIKKLGSSESGYFSNLFYHVQCKDELL